MLVNFLLKNVISDYMNDETGCRLQNGFGLGLGLCLLNEPVKVSW